MFAQVIISLRLPQVYTYKIPEEILPNIKVGVLVEVRLKEVLYCGIVYAIFEKEPRAHVGYLPILNILSKGEIVPEKELRVWAWMADYYMCSLGEVFGVGVPSVLKYHSEYVVSVNEDMREEIESLGGLEREVVDFVLPYSSLSVKKIEKEFGDRKVRRVLNGLIENEVLVLNERLLGRGSVRNKKVVGIGIHGDVGEGRVFFEAIKRFEKKPLYEKFLMQFWQYVQGHDKVMEMGVVKAIFGVEDNVIKQLLKAKILEKREILKGDKSEIVEAKDITIPFVLSGAQADALAEIKSHFERCGVVLLNGVTGSGKTQIYCELIKDFLLKQKQVLYLLPEIALTTQMIGRLEHIFGGLLEVYHSKIGDVKRKKIWDRVLSGSACVVLGARSATFLPFKELGLTIIDEEHDGSYKQSEKAPFYHARDVMIFKGGVYDSKTLLGSATPSLESYYNAKMQKYGAVNLRERFGKVDLPSVHIVNMREQGFKKGEVKIMSHIVKEKMEVCLKRGKQVIFFHNKKGFSPYLTCKHCGAIPYCEHCDVSLTYYKAKHVLKCHYCSTQYAYSVQCPICKNNSLEDIRFATEHIEDYLKEVFVDYKVLRLDGETARGKAQFEKILSQFEKNEAQILIGTQMVVKGLDFENVHLVVIADGDSLFHFSDYNISEKAFQLIQQVSGRAGRKEERGEVYIQLYQTQMPFINQIVGHGYEAFCEQEIETRKGFHYPPFTRVIEILFRHKDKEVAEGFANAFKKGIPKDYAGYFIGPSEPVVNRIKNKYIFQLTGKVPKNSVVLKKIKRALLDLEPVLYANSKWRGVGIEYRVDV